MSEADLAKKAKEKRQETNRLLQLSVVVGSFLFGYLPRTGSFFLINSFHYYDFSSTIFKESSVAYNTIFVDFLFSLELWPLSNETQSSMSFEFRFCIS